MSQGYDRFFKEARKVAKKQNPSRPVERADGRKSARLSGGSDRRGPNASPKKNLSPEQQLQQMIIERSQQKMAAKRRKSRPPVFALQVMACIGVFSGLGYLCPNSIDFLESHLHISVFGSARASESAKDSKANAATPADKTAKPEAGNAKSDSAANKGKEEKSAATDGKKEEKSASADGREGAKAAIDVKGWTAEELSSFNKLSDRKKELDLREAELNKLDEELQKERVELDKKIGQLEKMRAEIANVLKTRVANDQEKVGKLVEFYSGMKSQQAAKVIETINEDLAVEILDRMKKKNASEILNMMDAKKAKHLSEMLAGYRKTASE